MRWVGLAAAGVLYAAISGSAWAGLAASDFSFTPDPPVAGQPVTATVTVSGNSKGPVKVWFGYVAFWVKGGNETAHNYTSSVMLAYTELPSLNGSKQVTIKAVAPWTVGGVNAHSAPVGSDPGTKTSGFWLIDTECPEFGHAFGVNKFYNAASVPLAAPNGWVHPSGGGDLTGSFSGAPNPTPLVAGKWFELKATVTGNNSGVTHVLLCLHRWLPSSHGEATAELPMDIIQLPNLNGSQQVTFHAMAPADYSAHDPQWTLVLMADTGGAWKWLQHQPFAYTTGGNGDPGEGDRVKKSAAAPRPQVNPPATAESSPAAITARAIAAKMDASPAHGPPPKQVVPVEPIELVRQHVVDRVGFNLAGGQIVLPVKTGQGAAEPATIVAADADGLTVKSQGAESRVTWKALGEEGIYQLAQPLMAKAPVFVEAAWLKAGIKLGRAGDAAFKEVLEKLREKDAEAAKVIESAQVVEPVKVGEPAKVIEPATRAAPPKAKKAVEQSPPPRKTTQPPEPAKNPLFE